MSSTRSRSRSPVKKRNKPKKAKTMLYIRNLPRIWDYIKIKNFIMEKTPAGKDISFVDIIKLTGDCTVRFKSAKSAEQALDDLCDLKVEGNSINVKLRDAKLPIPIKQDCILNTPMKTDENPQEQTFGLSKSYLSALGIELPLINKIFVYNLSEQVDEAKLREIFGMAGCIMALVLKKHTEFKRANERMNITAKIEYDHPVEAVQAIAMFNNQRLYNKVMIMRLDHLVQGPIISSIVGLQTMGPALGENGRPMKNVRCFIEMQLLRQELFKKMESITNNSQQLPNNGNQINNSSNNQMVNMANQISSNNMNNQMMANLNPNMNVSTFNPGFMVKPMMTNQNVAFQPWPVMMPNQMNVMQNQANTPQINAWKPMENQNLANQGIAPVPIPPVPIAPVPIPPVPIPQVPHQAIIQGNVSFQGNPGLDGGLNMNWSQQQQKFNRRGGGEGCERDENNIKLLETRREGEERRQETASEMCVFKCLPPSVNFDALQQKMREIGELKFLEMTGHGTAIVRFMSPQVADKCIRMYDRSRVDGQMIEVKYF